MTLSATELRSNLYRILDRVSKMGETIEIVRNGKVIRIVPGSVPDKMSRIEKHPGYVKGDPDKLIHMDWSDQWKP